MADVILKFANDTQYQQFLSEVKKQVIEELNQNKTGFSDSWVLLRTENKQKMQTYAEGCGYKSDCIQAFNTMFRLAFKVESVKELSHCVETSKLRSFSDDLYALLDKYREEAK